MFSDQQALLKNEHVSLHRLWNHFRLASTDALSTHDLDSGTYSDTVTAALLTLL
jgi:hypothetical protein